MHDLLFWLYWVGLSVWQRVLAALFEPNYLKIHVCKIADILSNTNPLSHINIQGMTFRAHEDRKQFAILDYIIYVN